ncbi:hypothetical protein AQZ49_20680 [Novosphingobium sp. FSW06-99]|nr:hypothetical protein AQZ49_20680 [Novosphingobium sp. FSW06-99]
MGKLDDQHGRPIEMDEPDEHDDCEDEACPICDGAELSPEFVAMLNAAAEQPGTVYTREEFSAWLDSL